MLLHHLLLEFDSAFPVTTVPDIPIAGICEDSRLAKPGDLFVARAGAQADGRQFISDAIAHGAVGIIADGLISGCKVPVIIVPDPAAAVSHLAHIFAGRPSHALRVMGVTGTNGKTTTAYLIRHLLGAHGKRCGMIGTVEIDDGRQCREARLTTPSATEIARFMSSMRDNGADSCAIEVSSHALDQLRVAGVQFAAGIFTNLTGDHLDYHKTTDRYAAAKARLFEMLDRDAVAIMNAGDPWSHRMLKDSPARPVWWGLTPRCDYRAQDVYIDARGSNFLLNTPAGCAQVHMQLIGDHNIANALAAVAAVGELYQMPPVEMAAALATAAGAPGRLEAVRMGQPFGVFVDYAHTDDGLKNVLSALRPLTKGRLRVLFGCGGDRDATKRPRMAQIAEQLADVIYVTSDNPRSESPDKIIDQIVDGFSGSPAQKSVVIEADRHRAIYRAIGDAQPGDIVLLAGKGHEDYQIIGTEKRHFDDVEEAKAALGGSVSAAA